MANWFLILSAGFILLFAAIFLWIWVIMSRRRKAVRHQQFLRQQQDKEMQNKESKERNKN